MPMTKSEAGKLANKDWCHKLKQYNILQYNINPKKCLYCNSKIPYDERNKKFCNHSCAAIYLNKTIKKIYKKTRPHCIICNKPHQMNDKLCRFHYKEQQIKNGLVSERSTLRKWLIKNRGYCCENCKQKTWLNEPISLELHHIDGNAGNNFLTNLQILCPNCHAMMPNSKGKNRGNGRKTRGLNLN
jgi:hypothetical protein